MSRAPFAGYIVAQPGVVAPRQEVRLAPANSGKGRGKEVKTEVPLFSQTDAF